jgi:hypothetical protein
VLYIVGQTYEKVNPKCCIKNAWRGIIPNYKIWRCPLPTAHPTYIYISEC